MPGTARVVRLRGALDYVSAPGTVARLDALTSGPRPDLVLDLARLDFLDCCGVGVLCRARRRVLERGGRLSLVITDPHQLWILRTVGLGASFDVLDTVPDDGPIRGGGAPYGPRGGSPLTGPASPPGPSAPASAR
ncbi:STAS domain-containing protein [Streptomyces albospinus]|uniref:STAS domain-containing protein n=1 Tax=Streptomyces albospinus TaxID=285515 RepID=UPI00166FB69A|nr:STAS domain-containing protein [Streptomyces albospinus]